MAVDADGWMVVVLAVEPGDVKKRKKERKRKVLLTRMDSGRRVWVVAVYTADVEEERKKKKRKRLTVVGVGGRRVQWW